ncbi:MAG: hypothetical protein ACJ76H_14135 [Bacteriovoracaceae bacterium]
MKFSLFAFALFSTAVFAIGTNELTGTFEVKTSPVQFQPGTNHFTGASEKDAPTKTRMPASEQAEKKLPLHNELTGTFE